MEYEKGLTVEVAEARAAAAGAEFDRLQEMADAAFSVCCTLAHLDGDFVAEQAGVAFGLAWALRQAKAVAWERCMDAHSQVGFTRFRLGEAVPA